jgi:hypothetical protein
MPASGNGVFTIDGMDYRVQVMELKRGFKVTDSEHSGRTQDYSMHRDVIGTFYNYSLKVEPDPSYRSDYDRFYDVVSAPVNDHQLVFPYNGETLEFKAYVTSGDDEFTARLENGMQINRWSGLTLNFIAMEPQRRP